MSLGAVLRAGGSCEVSPSVKHVEHAGSATRGTQQRGEVAGLHPHDARVPPALPLPEQPACSREGPGQSGQSVSPFVRSSCHLRTHLLCAGGLCAERPTSPVCVERRETSSTHARNRIAAQQRIQPTGRLTQPALVTCCPLQRAADRGSGGRHTPWQHMLQTPLRC